MGRASELTAFVVLRVAYDYVGSNIFDATQIRSNLQNETMYVMDV